MEDRMQRALARWPNVPALYGWLSLDRRGRWRIQGEIITRAQIIDTISANYLADEHGAWYFQNGPQRGYVQLEAAPLILRADGEGLCTHTGAAVTEPTGTWLDEHGNLLMATEHGPAQLDDTESEWLLAHLKAGTSSPDSEALEAALAASSGEATALSLRLGGQTLPLGRLDQAEAPSALGFIRAPRPASDSTAAQPG